VDGEGTECDYLPRTAALPGRHDKEHHGKRTVSSFSHFLTKRHPSNTSIQNAEFMFFPAGTNSHSTTTKFLLFLIVYGLQLYS